MSQDKPVLSRERIHRMRTELIMQYCKSVPNIYPAKIEEIHALCDLALSALERQGWISVEERLPEEIGAYPVLVGDNRILRMAHWEEFSGRRLWTDYAYVTHWFDGLPPAHASAQINEPPQVTGREQSHAAGDGQPDVSSAGPASGSPDEEGK